MEARQELVVTQIRHEAAGVFSLVLRHPAGRPLAEWAPGAHIDTHLGRGLVRQYSLCGDPDDHFAYRLGILIEREGRGGSLDLYENYRVGDTLLTGLPRNHFQLGSEARFLFLAGGIGITPFLPMIRHVERARRPWSLVYGGRTRRSMAFLDEVLAYGPDRVSIIAEDESGRPDFDRLLRDATKDTGVYACGPVPMLGAVEQACSRNPQAGPLHLERFTAVSRPATELDANGAFKVELRRSNVVLEVPPDRTLLSVLQEVVDIPTSCEEGICGSCETRVLSGIPEHHDYVLNDQERESNHTMMPCVGRSKTPLLVLDL